MVATLQQIIGKINPLKYAENGKELLKKYGSPENIPAEEVEPKPASEHTLVYDSSTETLEPVYFFIVDLMDSVGLSTEKFVDNFTSSPGSGHFAELGQRATIMQQQASKILGDVNNVLRSVLNIIYDLKDFNTRLQHYDDLNSKDKDIKNSANLALKQIWMDRVDINKGNSSIKAMSFQGGFQTLIDAFLMVNTIQEVEKLDLNERVKRILGPRVKEFNIWLEQSEKELRKRYELERNYLRSQVNSLKLYSRWAKPYMKAAFQLEMTEKGREPALVKAFNTIIFELTLLGKTKIKISELAAAGDLPVDLKKMKIKRDFYSCVLVDFNFRGIPGKIPGTQHYSFGGKADINFRAYALNEDELNMLSDEFDKSDLGDVLKLIEGSTSESLEQLQEEINFFLEDKNEYKERFKVKDTSNPFVALLGGYEKKEEVGKTEKKESEFTEQKQLKKDDWLESQVIRPVAEEKAVDVAFSLFDVYKKMHGMPSYT